MKTVYNRKGNAVKLAAALRAYKPKGVMIAQRLDELGFIDFPREKAWSWHLDDIAHLATVDLPKLIAAFESGEIRNCRGIGDKGRKLIAAALNLARFDGSHCHCCGQPLPHKAK